MKTKKISKAYFNRFCEAFKVWQGVFGLTQYDVSFYQEKIDNAVAQIRIIEEGKIADVFLATKLKGNTLRADDGPESHAKHEAIHLLLNRLLWLGEKRFVRSDDLDEEWEALVRRLEKVL